MSNIVYTTAIKQETIDAYNRYQNARQKHPNGHVTVNFHWIQFCKACEKEHKSPLAVAEKLRG